MSAPTLHFPHLTKNVASQLARLAHPFAGGEDADQLIGDPGASYVTQLRVTDAGNGHSGSLSENRYSNSSIDSSATLVSGRFLGIFGLFIH